MKKTTFGCPGQPIEAKSIKESAKEKAARPTLFGASLPRMEDSLKSLKNQRQPSALASVKSSSIKPS